jgi:hypothetical protein
MKFQCLGASAIVCAGVLTGYAFAADKNGADTPNVSVVDQVIAKVNAEIVSQDELQRLQRELAAELKQQGATGATFDQQYQAHEKTSCGTVLMNSCWCKKAKS